MVSRVESRMSRTSISKSSKSFKTCLSSMLRSCKGSFSSMDATINFSDFAVSVRPKPLYCKGHITHMFGYLLCKVNNVWPPIG